MLVLNTNIPKTPEELVAKFNEYEEAETKSVNDNKSKKTIMRKDSSGTAAQQQTVDARELIPYLSTSAFAAYCGIPSWNKLKDETKQKQKAFYDAMLLIETAIQGNNEKGRAFNHFK